MDYDLKINNFSYNQEGLEAIKNMPYGRNWPHVYLIHDSNKMYIGETQNVFNRTKQHLDSNDVSVSKDSSIETIFDCSFNKSAILDIENSLIRLFKSENKFELLNIQPGQSTLHDYYQKDYYHNELTEKIWDKLLKLKLVNQPLSVLRNLDIFKFSPYVSITSEQLEISVDILDDMNKVLSANKTGTYIVNGGAGTGKTVLAIYLLTLLRDSIYNHSDYQDSEDYDKDLSEFNIKRKLIVQLFEQKNIKKIGFVVPMTSLRNTLKSVFRKLKLREIKVIGPNDVIRDDYDILFVDETHRLFHRQNITGYESYDNVCRSLNKDPLNTNQLQWVMLRSKYCVLFYDKDQTVKKSDITEDEFSRAIELHDSYKGAILTSQLRCLGGSDYTLYIDRILECSKPEKLKVNNYEIKVFDNANDLINNIKLKQKEYDLSFLVAGYGFKWISKGYTYEKAVANNKYDIEIDGVKLIWNTTPHGWIYSEHAKDEVGCIHTTQGYDLNYCGVIFGPEIDYDTITNKITINRNNFYDTNVMNNTTPDELKKYIINTYAVLLKRGIKGTYIYCVNKNLSEYFKKFFNF